MSNKEMVFTSFDPPVYSALESSKDGALLTEHTSEWNERAKEAL